MQLSDDQVLYNGRWVPRKPFRAFVYKGDEQRLATDYDDFSKLISSGIWHIDKEAAQKALESEEPSAVVSINDKGHKKCRNQANQ
jgi:hypothetical protein